MIAKTVPEPPTSAENPPSPRPDELRTIGVIVGEHGLQGTLRVTPLSDFPERYADLQHVFLMREDVVLGEYRVKRVKWMKNQLLLTLREITKREAAELLRGVELCVRETEKWALPDDVFYVSELIGFSAVSENRVIGTLTSVLEGAQDTLVITTPSGELLIPFVHEWVGTVDTAARTIEVLNWRRLTNAEELPPTPEPDDH